jgi:O-antigen ligase
MAVSGSRSLRGALAGAVAAGVWAVQQPLDKRVFGVDYDDADLLGRFVAPGRAGYLAGLALHFTNGALFGALYARVRPALPVPPALRGPLAGMAEHLATWPATAALPRVPAFSPLPRLWGSWPAFGQATWRHLLFGTVLGELERRLNPPEPEAEPMTAATAATNGHGAVEHLDTTPLSP